MTRAAKDGLNGAHQARVELGLGLESPLPDVLDVVESEAEVPVAVIELPAEVAGLIRRRPEGSFIFVNGTQSVVRQRFTLAHEFGHHYMKHGTVVDAASALFGSPTDSREVAANYFAGAFLAPEPAIRSWWVRHESAGPLSRLVGLATYFGISAHAALVRLKICQLCRPAEILSLTRAIETGEHRSAAHQFRPVQDRLAAIAHEGDLPALPREVVANVRKSLAAQLIDLNEAAQLLQRTDPRQVESLVNLTAVDEAELVG